MNGAGKEGLTIAGMELALCYIADYTDCKGFNGCVLCIAVCNNALHSAAPLCTATQCLTGIIYT